MKYCKIIALAFSMALAGAATGCESMLAFDRTKLLAADAGETSDAGVTDAEGMPPADAASPDAGSDSTDASAIDGAVDGGPDGG